MARPKLHIVPFKHLPEVGTPGSLYFVRDGAHAGETFIAARNGMLCPVSDIFNIIVPEGPRGPAGRDGINGKDGRDGVDGAPGLKGDAGDATFIGPREAQLALEKMKRRIRDYQARVQATIKEKIAGLGSHPAAKLAVLHLRSVEKVADNI